MERQNAVRVLAAVGDVIAILVAIFSAALFFNGAYLAPDSFLANMIAVAGIASGVVIVVVPVGLRTLVAGDPLKDFLEALRRSPEEGERAAPSNPQLLAKALFISAVPSPLSFLGDSVLSFVVSIGFSLYSNLHGDDLFSARLGFIFLVLGFLLLVEAGIAIIIVRRSAKTKDHLRAK